jgi:putative ABC transport system permease protein
VSAAIDKTIPENFPVKTKTKDQRSFMSAAVEDLREIVRLSHVVMAITLLVVLVSVANTISMATRDRTQEFGVIRSLGFRRGHVLGLVMGESLMLACLGGMLGLGAAYLVMNARDLYLGVTGMNLKIALTPEVAVTALLLSLLVGVLGGLLPAIGASRLKIVDSLRNVD